MTYRSRVWSVLFYVLLGLFPALLAIDDPEAYGLSPVAWRWLQLLAGVGLGVCGKLGASWLPGESKGVVDVKRFSSLVMLVALSAAASGVGGCAKGKTFETPKAQTAYVADQILAQVGHLQDATIQVEAAEKLATADARIILRACRVFDVALPAVPNGWRSTAMVAAWEVARQELVTKDSAGVVVYLLDATPPATWQAMVRQLWGALKQKIPPLRTNGTLAIAVGAIEGALAAI